MCVRAQKTKRLCPRRIACKSKRHTPDLNTQKHGQISLGILNAEWKPLNEVKIKWCIAHTNHGHNESDIKNLTQLLMLFSQIYHIRWNSTIIPKNKMPLKSWYNFRIFNRLDLPSGLMIGCFAWNCGVTGSAFSSAVYRFYSIPECVTGRAAVPCVSVHSRWWRGKSLHLLCWKYHRITKNWTK